MNQPPMWLEADTKEELRQLMLANNRRHGKRFYYFDFQFVNRKWICWFEVSEVDRRRVNGDL